ncbi:MAG: type II secretion system inner membrane protein GspF [Desulfuromonadaceae bacterium]|nr:type II secretion system inner membrane protein GspF [Desulfuromonadaceae bacterium]
MPQFDYVGLDRGGKKISGKLEASGQRAATRQLQERGIFATALREEHSATENAGSTLSFWRRVGIEELSMITRQLATLLNAGLPLDEALAAAGGQAEHPALVRTFSQVREDVLGGDAPHHAMARHPRVFSELFCNMVAVGESSGSLDRTLLQLADLLEEQARLSSRLRAALAYPLLMGIIGSGVLFFLVAFVVPKVTRMLEDMEQTLPWPTQLLITLSDLFAAYWWLLPILVGGGLWLLNRYRQTTAGRLRIDQLQLQLPLIGPLQLQIAAARLTRTLAALLRGGLPLLQALDISGKLLANRVLQNALTETSVAVREGKSLAEPLSRNGIFPAMVCQMIAVGERSGNLEEMLEKVASTFDHQVETRISGMLSLLEPLMILVMGVAVGFIVMAILLPIFQASQGIG